MSLSYLLTVSLLPFFPLLVDSQWNWNPFQTWNPQSPAIPQSNWQQPNWQQPAQLAANRDISPAQTARQRWREIYGIPGQRNANQKLRTCCRTLKDADPECRRKYCDFNALSSNQVIGFMAECASKGPTVGQMWDCASSRQDHTPCCQRQQVLPACIVYCQTTNGVPTDYLKYIVCLSQFDKIRYCFKEYLETNPNIKGQE